MNLSFKDSTLLTWIDEFLKSHPKADVFVVGGAVRDSLRGRETKDYDLVVSGLDTEELEVWLETHGEVDFVGKRFGVWKFSPHHNPNNPKIDIALPRKESSTGSMGGYTQFIVESDPKLPIKEDLARRDFTINAMAYSWRRDELIDPFDGQKDLREQMLRTVGDATKRLTEDSSRILRALRFACTLEYVIEPKAWEAIKKLVPRLGLEIGGRRVVAREMISEEFYKAFSANPKKCLELYRSSGAWSELFGDIESKDPFKRLGQRVDDRNPNLNLTLLCFDLFKDAHETYTWLHTWRFEMQLDIKPVVEAIRMMHTDPEKVSLAQIEKQLLPNEELILPFLKTLGETEWIKKIFETKKRTHLKHVVVGDNLIELGFSDGPRIGELLDKVRSAQLEGVVETHNEAIRFLKKHL